MTKPESAILKEVMLEASKHGCILWRNETGGYKLANGGFVRAGLCNGSSDLIGYYKCKKSGKAVFLAIEIKRPGKKLSPAQENFINRINENGGIAFVCDDKNNFEKFNFLQMKNRNFFAQKIQKIKKIET